MAVIETRELVKHYGRIRALDGVSIDVEQGEIFGLLGRNGAGKTTLVKILLGIVKPTRGQAQLLNRPTGTVEVRKRVGYLPEDHRFPDYHTGWSLLDFYGTLLAMPKVARRKQIMPMLELMGIAHRAHSKIRTYSKGMKQRLGMAQAMLHDPDVLFLDEPTDGVDPVGRKEIREILVKLKARGKTIFINSHLLGEVEMICDRVAIMELGEVARQGDVESLTRQRGRFAIGLAANEKFPTDELRKQGYIVTAGKDRDLVEIILQDSQTIDPVVNLLLSNGLHLRHLVEKRQTLEDLFMSIVDVEAAEA